jgi:hypothetical protein
MAKTGARRPAAVSFRQRSRAKGAEEKAIYHQVAGAGRSRVLRKFFELSDADLDAITTRLNAGVTLAVQRAS